MAAVQTRLGSVRGSAPPAGGAASGRRASHRALAAALTQVPPPPGLQVSLSKATGFKPAKAASARAPVARAVSCSAQKQEASKQVATGVAAAALALTFGFGAVDAAYADVAGLTPCSESKAFAKLKKKEVRRSR